MRPRWILVICVLVSSGIAGYALLSETGAPRLQAQQRELDAIEGDVAQLRTQNDALAQDAQRLTGDDPANQPYLEQAVRQELGYVRPDERVVLTEPRRADSGQPPEEQP
jgi:cell division protein FtsB